MKVITLTLNPAIDVHCTLSSFKLYHESVARVLSRDAGGKGVNLSRALLSCGVKNTALVVLGEQNGEEFKKELISDGLDVVAVWEGGRIRENITVHDKSGETRLSFEGFSASKDLLRRVEGELPEDISDTVITFTGSVPEGIDKESVIEFLGRLKSRGARLVLDSRSLTLEDIVNIRPWLIKPNEGEAESYSGKRADSIESAIEIALAFNSKGIENVLLSLGERGAVLASDGKAIYVKAPSVNAVSTIGAGDSMIAGFISASIKGMEREKILAYSVACGSSACEEEGTKPPKKERIEELYKSLACGKAQ